MIGRKSLIFANMLAHMEAHPHTDLYIYSINALNKIRIMCCLCLRMLYSMTAD